MIESLTKDQEARMAEFRDKWIAIGLSTEPADRKRAEEGVKLAYAAGGLEPPKEIYWVESPFAGLKKAAELSGDASDELSQLYRCGYGQHDASWLSFYDFFGEVLGIDVSKMKGLMEIGQSCGWWWPFDDVCVLADRAEELKLDDRGRLHNITGPAMKFRDGFAIYAIHGVRLVDGSWIEDRAKLTVDAIDRESNAEIRRVMIETFGAARFIQEGNSTLVDTSKFGKLWTRAVGEQDEPLVMVELQNSTAEPDGTFKTYHLRVPPTTKTAQEAVAWSFGMTAATYSPSAES